MLRGRLRLAGRAAIVLLLTLTPLMNHLCERRCDRPSEASCPQHPPTPSSGCTHDHSVMRADVPRAPAPGSTNDLAPLAVVTDAPVTMIGLSIARAELLQSPPHPLAPLQALRI
jgi:hypothetical protein